MSASLVGSEMCIRDSRSRRASPGSCSRTCPGATASDCPARSGRGRTPVSYTHLTLPTICSV
eukprot:3346215-Alexandrium_andersonii.AAC.1